MTNSNSIYNQACTLIKRTPTKLTFDQIVNQLGVELTPSSARHISLAIMWAQQAHKSYIQVRRHG